MRPYPIVFTVLLLVGAAAPTPALAQASEPAPAGGVTVIDPGAEPRSLLRYTFVEGQTETTDIAVDMAMSMSVNDMQMMEMDLPMSMSMTTTVTDVSADGVARVDFMLTGFDLGDIGVMVEGVPADDAADSTADDIAAQAEAMAGAAGWMEIDDRGVVLDFGLEDVGDVPPEALQQSQQAAMQAKPLPDIPVGVGAVWQSSMAIDQAGLALDVDVTSELVELTETGFVTEDTFSMALDADAGLAGFLPPGVDLSFDDFSVEGDGRSEVRLDRLGQSSEMDMRMHMAMSAAAEGESMDLVMDLDMAVTSTPQE